MAHEDSGARLARTPLRTLGLARRRVLLHRRGLAALLLAAAVAAGLSAVRAPAPATSPVWVAAHDLDGGRALISTDVRRTTLPVGAVPDGSLAPRDLAGRRLAGPVRAGEPLTDRRLLGRSLLSAYPGRSAVPVRLADPGVARLLRPGQRVDLVSTDPQSADPADLVTIGAVVLSVVSDKADDAVGGRVDAGDLAVLAVDDTDATDVVATGARGFLSVVLPR